MPTTMAAPAERPPESEASALGLVVCPRCRGRLIQGATVSCAACQACYPYRHGCLDLTTGHAGEAAYDPHYYEALARVEARHFWFVARRERVLEALKAFVPDLARRPMLDVGSGSGGLLAFLHAAGLPVAAACDAYPRSLELVRERIGVPTILVDEGGALPLARGQRLVTLFDVLEHVDDDAGVLASIHDALEPGGYLALTVPAHPALFDEMDRMAHHRRRYSRAGLRQRLEGAGFEIRALLHFMSLLVPLLLALRLVGRLLLGRPHERVRRSRLDFALLPVLNGLMLAVLRGEAWLARAVRLPFGTSLLAVARRPASGAGEAPPSPGGTARADSGRAT